MFSQKLLTRTSSSSPERAEELLRNWERTVLDVHYQSLRLYGRKREEAIYAVLAAYDSMVVPTILSPVPPGGVRASQIIKSWDEGLVHALRWLCDPAKPIFVASAESYDLIDEGGEFLQHCSRYVDIADQHIAFGRGLCTLDADEARRVVRFVPIDSGALRPMYESVRAQERRDVPRLLTSIRKKRAGFDEALRSLPHHTDHGRIVIENPEALSDQRIVEYAEVVAPRSGLMLAEETDLRGFSLAEFRRYWLAVLRWSWAATTLFIQYFKTGSPQHECLPTQIVSRDHYLKSVSALACLDCGTVERITERLTYRDSIPRPDVFLLPLLCRDESIAWSPRLISHSNFERNMLKRMSKTPDLSNIAANVVGSQSRPFSRKVGELLAARGGFQFQLGIQLKADGEQAEFDLLAYSRKAPRELLLIETKALLEPDEVNEVHAAMQEMIHGQEQLRRAMRILSSIPLARKRALVKFIDWPKIESMFGVVIVPNTEPVQGFDDTEIPAISLEAIMYRMRTRDFSRPRKFWLACREREWAEELLKGHRQYRPYQIGDVTYEIPEIVLAAS